jgi:tetratricopeptide (TPR) repeat protein
MAKKKRKRAARAAPPGPSAPPRSVIHLLEGAGQLVDDGDLTGARDVLEALADQRPRDVDVLTLLVNVYFDLHDLRGYQAAVERLLRITPNDVDLTLALGGAYLANLYPALALRTFRRALERWPDDDRAPEVCTQITDLEALMPEFLQDLGVTGEEGMELAAQHEQVRALFEQGSYPDARRAAEQLLRR